MPQLADGRLRMELEKINDVSNASKNMPAKFAFE